MPGKNKSLRITIACSGRFHVGDLARELLRLGEEVHFHSIVPSRRMLSLGVSHERQTCYLAAVLPWVVAQRKLRCSHGVRDWLDRKVIQTLDQRYCRIQDFGDVFIGMSGLCVESLKVAKRQGARIILERGSCHILSQREILDRLSSKQNARSSISSWIVDRELEGYELADIISIPSRHVEDSFLQHGVPKSKLVRNPYGVNLEEFRPETGVRKCYDVITTGTWCLRKGSDLLAQVVLEELRLKLLHVGPVGDCRLPIHPNFQHVDAVPQNQLKTYYNSASVFAMPSFEEGLSMVQAQALACGIPIVGSTHSGAADLGGLLGIGVPMIQSVVPGNAKALAIAIRKALECSHTATDSWNEFDMNKERLSWASYGFRYREYLLKGDSHD